jgi:hypothetical protein
VKVLGFLLRVFSYLFHLTLSLFLLGLGLLSSSAHQPLKLAGLLPFTDENLLRGVFSLAIVGLVSTILAITNIFKYLFPLWTVVVLYLMVKGFIFSTFSFSGADSFKTALWLMGGALLALIGGLWVLKPRRGRL